MESPALKFSAYILVLILFSAFISDYGNIDLLAFWQGGHWPMLILSLFPTALLIHTFLFLRIWGSIPLWIWLLLTAIQVYILDFFNYRVSFGLISLLFETDLKEAGAFVTPFSLFLLFSTLAFALFFCWGMSRLKKGMTRPSLILWAALLLLTIGNSLFVPAKPSMRETALWPFNNIGYLGNLLGIYWFQERPLMQSLATLPSVTTEPSSFTPFPEGLTVVFHLGETARADHWGLNGYSRNTTPFATSEHATGNFINFPRSLSFGAGTRLSCVGMLTPASLARNFPEYGPLFDFYEKHGFNLHAFRSNQKADDQIYDSTLITLSKIFRGRTTYEPGTADQIAPAMIRHIREEQNPLRFLFYYGEGSHGPYLYAEKFAPFKPDNMDPLDFGKTPEQLVNRYDNSIYATDQFMGQIIDSLRDKCALYIYAGDHGEYLGEYGNYSHGNNLMCHAETRYIPLFIWFSPSFEKARPELARQLRENARKLPLVSHDFLFHTTLSLSGIKSSLINPELDLSSPHAKPHQGKTPEEIDPEFVFDSLLKQVPN